MPISAAASCTEPLNTGVAGVQARDLEAGETLASQHHLVYSAEQWEAFMALLNHPAQDRPRLKKLLHEPSVLERD